MQKMLGGQANVDDNVLYAPAGTYRAITIRVFDPAVNADLLRRHGFTSIDPDGRVDKESLAYDLGWYVEGGHLERPGEARLDRIVEGGVPLGEQDSGQGQARLLALSSNSAQVSPEGAGHMVQIDAPDATVAMVRRVWEAARDGTLMAPAAAAA